MSLFNAFFYGDSEACSYWNSLAMSFTRKRKPPREWLEPNWFLASEPIFYFNKKANLPVRAGKAPQVQLSVSKKFQDKKAIQIIDRTKPIRGRVYE